MATTQSERLLQSQSRRKFSFPATLHSAALLEVGQRETTRRRLSNVSDVVTRKLSYTIGWKAAQIPAQDIITQVWGIFALCLLKLKRFSYRDVVYVDNISNEDCADRDYLIRSWDYKAFVAFWATAAPRWEL